MTTAWVQTPWRAYKPGGGHTVAGGQLPMTKMEWAESWQLGEEGWARPTRRNRSSVSATAKGKGEQQTGGCTPGRRWCWPECRLRAPSVKQLPGICPGQPPAKEEPAYGQGPGRPGSRMFQSNSQWQQKNASGLYLEQMNVCFSGKTQKCKCCQSSSDARQVTGRLWSGRRSLLPG